MKKIINILLISVISLILLVGCSSSNSTDNNLEVKNADSSENGSEIAMIIDLGGIDDKSFNQGTYEGIKNFAETSGVSYKYYKANEVSDESFITTIDLAIKGGAKTVVCPGYLFENAIYQVQDKYPDVNFILIDGTPKDENKVEVISKNVSSILFAEEQAGFLAGYAAVKDGYRNLGFMGGLPLPAVIRYGYGFVQGAEYAAEELELKKGELKIKYTYVGNFDATPENTSKAESWYQEGTEVIFACGGLMGNSVMKAAEKTGKKVIGVDVDQSSESESIITSAIKNLKNATYNSLQSIYSGEFIGGTSITLDASTNDVILPMETSKFENFTEQDYNKIYEKISNSEIKVLRDTDIANLQELNINIAEVSEY